MSNIQPFRGLLPASRAGRSLNRLSDQTTIGVALIQAKAELEAGKVDGIATVSSKAMQDIALLSRMEQSLAQAVPHASGRLAVIADLTAMAMADVVSSAARKIGQ